jgi:hypothetical protein
MAGRRRPFRAPGNLSPGPGSPERQFVPRRPAVFARCYGPAPLRIYLGTNLGGRELGVIPCDNAQHELLGRAGSRPPNDLTVFTGDLTAWRADLGSVP